MRGSSASTLCSAAHVSPPALQRFVRGAWPNQVLDYRAQTARDLNAAGFQGRVEAGQREGNTSIVLRVHRAHFESPDAPEEHKHHAGRMRGPARAVRRSLRENTPGAGIEAGHVLNGLEVRRACDKPSPLP